MVEQNHPNSSSEKTAVSRRKFFNKGMKAGLQVFAGLFAFVPAANVLAENLRPIPNYVPCQSRVCYGYTCRPLCAGGGQGCYCYDARNQSISCGCGNYPYDGCTQVAC